jgi:hypothetical protein
MEILGFIDDLVSGEELDLQEIDLPLGFGYLSLDLFQPVFKGLVVPSKTLFRHLPVEIEPHHPLHFLFDILLLLKESLEKFFLFMDCPVGHLEVVLDLRGGIKEVLELFMENRLEILDPDLVPALAAGVLRGVRRNVHLPPAVANNNPREKIDYRAGRWPVILMLFIENLITLIPSFFGNNRLDFREYPIGGWFQLPVFFVSQAFGVIGSPETLGARVLEKPRNRGIAEF